jgi:hypothetical protein
LGGGDYVFGADLFERILLFGSFKTFGRADVVANEVGASD